jgi:hypothetical protein
MRCILLKEVKMKVKVKFALEQARKTQGGKSCITLLFL